MTLRPTKYPSFWTLQIIGWLAYWLMICITFLPVLAPGRSIYALFEHKFFRALIGFGLSCVLRLIYRRVWADRSIYTILILSVACSAAFGVLWTASMYFFYALTDANFQVDPTRAPKDALDYSATFLAWSAIYFSWKYFRQSKTESENALQSAALADKAQLEMLRYQLNPHFLFNALNSIRASVDEDAKRAKRMITQLSEFLRYSLLHGSTKKIALRDELEAVRNYLAIEKIRFEEKLEVAFDIEPAAEDYKVPAYILNPLVENAIKHGLRNGEAPLRIVIAATSGDDELNLSVANSGTLSNGSDLNGTKIGLKNVRDRLKNMPGEKGEFELVQDGDFVKALIKINAKNGLQGDHS